MKNSRLKLTSVCAAIAILCAMLASCADPGKNSGVKDPVSTKPTASTTKAETTAEDTTADDTTGPETMPSEEEILNKIDENSISVIGTAAYITPSADLDLWSCAEIMQNNYEKYSDINKIVVDGIVFNTIFKNLCTNFEGDPDMCLYIKSIIARGLEKVFDEPEGIYGNRSWGIYQTDDAVIVERSTYGAGIKIIFTQSGISEINDDLSALGDIEDCYNYPIISFNRRDDGKIGYSVSPRKDVAQQDTSALFTYFVSRNELCRIEGYVSFDNGKIEYHPEKRLTVSDCCSIYVSLDESFETYKGYDPDYFKARGIETLDDMFKYNSERYEEFKY